MHLLGLVGAGRGPAVAFLGEGVDDHGAAEALGAVEGLGHLLEAVAVDGADVLDAEVGEHALRGEGVLEAGLGGVEAGVGGAPEHGDALDDLLDLLERGLVAGVEAQAREAFGEAADGGRVGAAVVVDDDDEFEVVAGRDVVERLPAHAAGERAVADEGHDVPVGSAERVGLGEAVGVGEGGGGVGVLDEVVRGLGLAGVAGESPAPAQPGELPGAPGECFVDVRLVAGVEDDLVVRGVEDPVHGHGHLDDPEVGADVAAGPGDGADEEFADLLGEPRQVGLVQRLEIGQPADAGQQRAHLGFVVRVHKGEVYRWRRPGGSCASADGRCLMGFRGP